MGHWGLGRSFGNMGANGPADENEAKVVEHLGWNPNRLGLPGMIGQARPSRANGVCQPNQLP